MIISKDELNYAAQREGFRVEILEKTWQLISLLDSINREESLMGKYALKGGTALNLFYFKVPRLSVDIDLNYIGSPTLETMKDERTLLEKNLLRVYQSQDMIIKKAADSHAGGKYELLYSSPFNQGKGTIEVDLNYMFRLPLFPPQKLQSQIVGGRRTQLIQLVSFEETIAGKLSALLNRNAARDLFDAYHILFETKYNISKVKTAFLAYYVMEERKTDEIPFHTIQADPKDIINKLQPVIRKSDPLNANFKYFECAKKTAMKVQNELKDILALNTKEKKFLQDHKNGRKLDFSLISEDPKLIQNLENHPLIKWVQQKRNQPIRPIRG